MKALPKNPLMQHRPDTIEQVRKIFNMDKPGRMEESIDILQDWAKKQPHFNKKDFERDYLENIIIRCKGSVEKAKKRLESLCTMRTIFPHFFQSKKPNEMPKLDNLNSFVIPKQTNEYCTIHFIKCTAKEFDGELVLNQFNRLTYYYEYYARYDYNAGFIAITDMRESELFKMMIAASNVNVVQGIIVYLKSFGARLYACHMLVDSNIAENFLSFVKTLISKGIDKFYIHKNLESLHKHVDKDLLPADYGGKEESSSVLAERNLQFLSSDEMMKHMKEMSTATIDTKIKPVYENYDAYLGIPGSFRRLEVD